MVCVCVVSFILFYSVLLFQSISLFASSFFSNLGGTVEENLKKIAERRTDIFGVGGEEAQIGQKVCVCGVLSLLNINQ